MSEQTNAGDTWKVRLEKWVLVSQIFSLVAIPVVLAVVGYWVQRTLQDQQIERDYVNLAVSMLKTKEPDDTPHELKAWAVRLLNRNSPVPLTSEEESILVRRGLGTVMMEDLKPGDIIFFHSNRNLRSGRFGGFGLDPDSIRRP